MPGNARDMRKALPGPHQDRRSARRVRPASRRNHRHRLLPRTPGPLQGAAGRYLRDAAEDLNRQNPEIRAARAREGMKSIGAAIVPPLTLAWIDYCGQIFQITPVPGICTSGPLAAPT